MTHGSLFSGIGGFDLAAEWMGWENLFHCEWNPFGQQTLKYYWPYAQTYHDIKTTDFTIWRGRIDVLTGSFPCQPYSTAGKRKGKADDRHLWPEMLRAIREIRPGYVVGENVRGLTNWNGGMVFDEVQADLEAEGYEVTPFLLPACAVNAPHRRDRIWFVAHNKNDKRDGDYCRCGRLRQVEPLEVANAQKRICLPDGAREGREEMENDFNASASNGGGERRRSGPHQPGEVRQQEGKSEDSKPLGEQPQQDKGKRSFKTEGAKQMVRTDICKECQDTFGMLRHEGGSVPGESESGGDGRTPTHSVSNGHSNGLGESGCKEKEGKGAQQWEERDEVQRQRDGNDAERTDVARITADANPPRLSKWLQPGVRKIGRAHGAFPGRELTRTFTTPGNWDQFPTQPPVRGKYDGISGGLAGITLSKHRNESLKAYGNAIVPQVAYQIFRAIEKTINSSSPK